MTFIDYQEVEDYVIQLKNNNVKVVDYKHIEDKFNVSKRLIRRYMKRMIDKGIVRSRMIIGCTSCGMPNVIYDHIKCGGSCTYCNEVGTLDAPLQLIRTWLIVNQ